MIRVDMDKRGATRNLNAVKSRLGDLGPGFKKGAEKARKVEVRWFAAHSGGGGRWPWLREKTALQRGLEGPRFGYYRRFSPAGAGSYFPILLWTGRLARSFQRKGARGHVSRPLGPKGFVFGSDYEFEGVPLADIHHRGKGKGLPRRPLLDEKGITKAFREGLEAHVRRRPIGGRR